jgi:hypothetical protein
MNQKHNDTDYQFNELVFHLLELNIQENEQQQVTVTAELELRNEISNEEQSIKTESYPLVLSCPIQQDEIQWYLTQYRIWPSFKHRAKAREIESQILDWGGNLYDAVFPSICNDILNRWYQPKNKQRIFSVCFDITSLDHMNHRAIDFVLSQPWHMMHDGDENLFWNKKRFVNVRCQIPFHNYWERQPDKHPLRILFVNPRPEDGEKLTDTDHRYIAKPLIQEIQKLGCHISMHLLKPPTLLKLELTLKAARQAGEPYHVVHFDGHWINHPESGLIGFCFEDTEILSDTHQRKVCVIDAEQLAKCMQSFEIPVVFLSTCQYPENRFSQVITHMLHNGVSSVITLPFKLMPETTTPFLQTFYRSLIKGHRISQAMRAGQEAIKSSLIKKDLLYDRAVHVKDWFVPVLVQSNDPQLFQYLENISFESEEQEVLNNLPYTPANVFVGRSQECLYLERFLENENWAVIKAKGGEGKTALASEMARWFLLTSHIDKVVYIRMNYASTATSILNQIGAQVLSLQVIKNREWKDFTYTVLKQIYENRVLFIFDNMEYISTDSSDYLISNDLKIVYGMYLLFERLLEIPKAKIIFNTSVQLHEPFDIKNNIFKLKPLTTNAAIELIYASMKERNYFLKHTSLGRPEDNIERLIQTVHYHPQCLIRLAPTINRMGINLTIRKISTLMNRISKFYSDPRECALAASFELALQRFNQISLKYVNNLAVFHDTINQKVFHQMCDDYSSALGELLETLRSELEDEGEEENENEIDEQSNISDMLGLDPSDDENEDLTDSPIGSLQDELVRHGLAWEHREQIILKKGLTDYIKTRLPKMQYPHLRKLWARGMEEFVYLLNSKLSNNPSDCIQKALMDFPNIIHYIMYCISEDTPEEILELIDVLYPVLEKLEFEIIISQIDLIREKLIEYTENPEDIEGIDDMDDMDDMDDIDDIDDLDDD